MCGIFCYGDLTYQYKKPQRSDEDKGNCRDKRETVCRVLLFYPSWREDYLYFYHDCVCMSSGGIGRQCGSVAFGILLGGLAIVYLDLTLQDKLTARRQELVLDLPQVLSKLTLLVNSGMVLREAWRRVSVTGDRVLYKEMQNTSLEIENGVMESDAYRNFADRCNVKEIRKFASLIIQNLKKGNEELAYFLKDLSDEMWEVKKNEVKQKGEKANSKLLFPMMLIFIGILLMILVPVFQQMG